MGVGSPHSYLVLWGKNMPSNAAPPARALLPFFEVLFRPGSRKTSQPQMEPKQSSNPRNNSQEHTPLFLIIIYYNTTLSYYPRTLPQHFAIMAADIRTVLDDTNCPNIVSDVA